MGNPRIPLLDHGYLELIEVWGSDERVIEAARMSTGKGFLGWGSQARCKECGVVFPRDGGSTLAEVQHAPNCSLGATKSDTESWKFETLPGDEKLLRFLWENKHATPFEMAGLVIEVQAPIFVFREWHRHRTQSYNEMSARYIPLPDVNYIPSVERLLINSKTNKQAGTIKGAGELTETEAGAYRLDLAKMYASQQALYEEALQSGVPKELARVHLPVGRYSRMRASANLRNWLAFLTLRMAPGAQWEIRQYASALGVLINEHFPRTWGLFVEGNLAQP